MDAFERKEIALSMLSGCRIGVENRIIWQQHSYLDNNKRIRKIGSIVTFKRENNRFGYKSCSKKCAYRSQSEATRKLHTDEQRFGVKGRVYYCDICNRYHLTFSHIRH